MSPWRFVLHSLTYHWRINLAVALSVAAATAVLTGALLVGDSVRGSLRALTLDRLGAVEEVLVTDHFFRWALVDELAADDIFQRTGSRAVPLIMFPQATVQRQGGQAAARVLVIGSEEGFWQLDQSGIETPRQPGRDEVVINRTVAEELQVGLGDEIILRLPSSNQVPADSPLANKRDRVRNVAGLKIVDIVSAEGLGRFSLRPSQQLARNVYVSLELLQSALDQVDRVNTVLVASEGAADAGSRVARRAALRPSLDDLGLSLNRVQAPPAESQGVASEPAFDYYQLTTDRMILGKDAAATAIHAWDSLGGQAVLTYLANTIAKVGGEGDREIPYSTVTAIDFNAQFPLLDLDGEVLAPLAEDEIVLNQWAANDLEAQPGDTIRLTYFAPETTHGQAIEESAEFRLRAVTPLTEPRWDAEYDNPPMLANDPDLTPTVKGVTDQESIRNWDPPFPYDPTRIQDEDDDYWALYRTTPKAFVSLAAGSRLWGSRFGTFTSVRVPAADGVSESSLAARFSDQMSEDKVTLGFEFRAIKEQQLAASKGTTPFDVLFLALSFFIIAASLLLVSMLFRLGVEQRASEVGILLASGVRGRRVRGCLVREGLIVAAFGAGIGIAVGVAYAWLIVAGLRTWWVGAITTPFLQFHYSAISLVLGYGLGLLICVLTIWWSVRQLRRISARRLLSGQASDAGSFVYTRTTKLRWVALGLMVIAIVLSGFATRLIGMPQAGAFFGAGSLLLIGLLLLVWARLRTADSRADRPLAAPGALFKLALRNAGRNPSRSAITIGLMASATFLIVALSSFRLDPTDAGTGGFDLVAESAEPIYADLNSDQGREEALAADAELVDGATIFSLRQRAGDDASCNNLYKSSQPRVIGITSQMIHSFDDSAAQQFAWASSTGESAAERSNPWQLLIGDPQRGADEPVPVVIDMNTAMYSLGLPPGAKEYEAEYDGVNIRFRIVALLENSLLQGSLLVGEADFERLFPEISGYRYFLIRSPANKAGELTRILEDRLGDQGFDAISTHRVLEQLLTVQNTYLSTFQSLGALGLLLGTLGMAAIQLRNIAERRGELALLRATGFRSRRLAQMVLFENVILLIGGLGTGSLAALLAVFPHKLLGEAAVSWRSLGDLFLTLVIVFLIGVITGLITVRAALRTPVMEALRGN
jgi:putative ABC transport system permease protein